MRILQVMILGFILISQAAFAKDFSVKCYSNNLVIFDKVVQDVSEMDGMLALKDGNNIIFINANCVIKYAKPVHKKKKK